jgi:hypothetical protein
MVAPGGGKGNQRESVTALAVVEGSAGARGNADPYGMTKNGVTDKNGMTDKKLRG